MTDVSRALLATPFNEMIEAAAKGVAQAQHEMDLNSVGVAQMMSGQRPDGGGPPITIAFDGERLTLLELGFVPNFYQFVETIVEIKMSVEMTRERSSERSTSLKKTTVTSKTSIGWFSSTTRTTTKVSTVSARYASRFQYHAEGASLVRTKMAPIPPPPELTAWMEGKVAAIHAQAT